MKVSLTPWARGALTDEQRLRLRVHLTERVLQVTGTTPGRYTIRINPGHHEWHNVGQAILWDVIVKGMAEAGAPLEPDDEWMKTKEALDAAAG